MAKSTPYMTDDAGQAGEVTYYQIGECMILIFEAAVNTRNTYFVGKRVCSRQAIVSDLKPLNINEDQKRSSTVEVYNKSFACSSSHSVLSITMHISLLPEKAPSKNFMTLLRFLLLALKFFFNLYVITV